MYLGIDWGDRKIGLAVAEEETRMAFGLQTILNDASLWQNLEKIIQSHSIEKIVIGISKHQIQNDNSQKIKLFAQELENKFGKAIFFTEEMFSTREAQNNLKQAEVKNIGQKDDVESARILLQSYLDFS